MSMGKRYHLFDDSIGIVEHKRTAQRYVECKLRLAKVGILEYVHDGKLVKVFRGEDIFDEEVVRSAQVAAGTNEHPRDSRGKKIFLTSKNTKKYQVGFLKGLPYREDVDGESFLTADAVITDETTIEDVVSGRKPQISPGVWAETLPIPGIYKGVKYDMTQKVEGINHYSHVKGGRHGPTVKAIFDDDEDTFESVKIGDREVKVLKSDSEALKGYIDGKNEELNTVRGLKSDLEKQYETAKTSLEKAQSDLSKLKKESYDDDDVKREAVKLSSRYQKVRNKAVKILKNDKSLEKFDEALDSDGLINSVVKERYPKLDLDGRSIEYIEGRFDSIEEEVKTKNNEDLHHRFKDRKDEVHDDDENEDIDLEKAYREQKRAKSEIPNIRETFK